MPINKPETENRLINMTICDNIQFNIPLILQNIL